MTARRIRALMGVPGPRGRAAPAWLSGALVAVLLGVSWALSTAGGGAGVIPPHWFYVPIALGAARFGYVGATITGVAAGLLAGPLLPLSTEAGTSQPLSDWGTRGAFFLLIGLAVAWAVDLYRAAVYDLRSIRSVTRALMGTADDRPPEAVSVGQRRIRAALAPGALEIVLHPVVELSARRAVGYEALSRFRLEPPRPPNEWFAEAWSVGLGVDLEMTAVEAALPALEALPEDRFLAVNLSPATVLSGRLDGLGRDARRLVVEMTEHVPVSDYAALGDALRTLRGRGIRFAVDDAGAGYASLRHLIRTAPDIIKIDLGLVRGIDQDLLLRSVTRALANFGEQSGALVVAEGIETEGELRTLRALGVEYGQGYLFGHPVPLRRILNEPVTV